jgi:hypothetical protein
VAARDLLSSMMSLWRRHVDVEIGAKKSAVRKKSLPRFIWRKRRISAKRAFPFTNPFVEEAYDLIFIHAAVLSLEHVHNALVIPSQMLLE